MKDLQDSELKRFEVPFLGNFYSVSARHSPSAKISVFHFPADDTKNAPVIQTFVTHTESSGKPTLVRLSTCSVNNNTMRTISPSELNTVRQYIMKPDETLVWTCSIKMQEMRSKMFRQLANSPIDVTNFILHTSEYKSTLPPLQEIYSKKVQKNRGYMYTRGTIDGWRYILVETKNPFPWTDFQLITKKEFGLTCALVFFNEETQKHPNHFIIVEDPNLSR